MFMFCYFYDDDNDDLPNVLTLNKRKVCIRAWKDWSVDKWLEMPFFWAFSVFDASSAAALLNSYSGNKQKKTLASIPLSSPDLRCSRCYMLSAVE